MKKPTPKRRQRPILTFIQDIKDRKISPDTLTKPLRQQCVEVFWGEGQSIAWMAQVLNRCEKTIARDLEDIRGRNGVLPDPTLAKKIIGEYLTRIRIHSAHLMRLARDKNASVSEKAQAELYAAQIGTNLITKLQSLGYLPTLPQAIVGEVTHHKGNSIKNPIIKVVGVPVKPKEEEPKHD